MGSSREQNLCMHGLRHSAGFLQAKLAKRLQTRFTPVIEFVLDEGVKKSIEMTRLINEALSQSSPNDQEGAAPDVSAHSADGTAEESPQGS